MLVRAIKSVKREVRQLLPAIRAMSVEKTDPLALLRKAVKEQGSTYYLRSSLEVDLEFDQRHREMLFGK